MAIQTQRHLWVVISYINLTIGVEEGSAMAALDIRSFPTPRLEETSDV